MKEITAEEYNKLLDEWAGIEYVFAQGEDTPELDARIIEIEKSRITC